jgi:hypothetical protein
VAPTRRPRRRIFRAELFTADECRAIVAAGEAHGGWQRARVLRRGRRVVREDQRRAEVLEVAGPRADPILARALAPYLARVFELAREIDAARFHTDIRAIQAAQLVRYPQAGHYAWHRDATDPGFRKLTALCYLTDLASDEVVGGETAFAPVFLAGLARAPLGRMPARWLGWLSLVERPRRGRALVFDARLPHRAQPVRGGTKISLNVWFV